MQASSLVALACLGSVVLRPGIGPNLAAVDVVIVAIVLAGCADLLRRRTPARDCLAGALPWLWLILLGSVGSLVAVGLTSWALDSLARSALAFSTFFTAWQLLAERPRAVRLATLFTVAAVWVTAISTLVFDQAARPSGTFDNPNYTGHFLALAVPILVGARLRPLTGPLTGALLLAALLRSGSFGAWAMVLTFAAALVFRRPVTGRHRGLGRVTKGLVLGGLLITTALGVSRFLTQQLDSGDLREGTDLAARRLATSSTSRRDLWESSIELWPNHPFGVGPRGTVNRPLLDQRVNVHSDLLGYLVERGPLGLIGLIGFGHRLWRSAPRGGVARQLLVGAVVGGLFHDTTHYRHLWLLLAVGFAHDGILLGGTNPRTTSRRELERSS